MKTINLVSKTLKMSISSIYFYEKEKIVIPQRGENNYRYYSEYDIKVLKLTKLLREYDFSIEEIKLAIKNYEGLNKGENTSEDATLFFENKKEQISKKIEGYKEILTMIDQLPALENEKQLMKKKREADELIERLFKDL